MLSVFLTILLNHFQVVFRNVNSDKQYIFPVFLFFHYKEYSEVKSTPGLLLDGGERKLFLGNQNNLNHSSFVLERYMCWQQNAN